MSISTEQSLIGGRGDSVPSKILSTYTRLFILLLQQSFINNYYQVAALGVQYPYA